MFLHGKDSRAHRVGRHRSIAQAADRGRPPDALRRGGGQSALQPRQVGRRATPRRTAINRYRRGMPPKSKGDYAFISHMIETALTEGTGRVAVVVPHGVLFRGGAEGRIRQALIEENLLDAVIGLPANLFSGTAHPGGDPGLSTVAAMRGGEREAVPDVLFIDASREFEAGQEPERGCAPSIEVPRSSPPTARGRTVDKYAYVASRRGDRRERFQPEHPALRRHLRGGRGGGYRPRCSRRLPGSRRSWHRCGGRWRRR
ncbi:MAG: SAM-dependent methyltransferase [Chromatiales bacterium]|nr:SAM-dependent methyltransferase [Chromatiales bacterium]